MHSHAACRHGRSWPSWSDDRMEARAARFFFSSRRRHTRSLCDWSSDVCSSDLRRVGGGPGLIQMLTDAATKRGIEIRYRTRALSLLYDGVRVSGVRIRHDDVESELPSKSVVLASGGFESNSEWRTRYLGPGWDLAKVRGTRFNTGDGIRMALDIGASP